MVAQTKKGYARAGALSGSEQRWHHQGERKDLQRQMSDRQSDKPLNFYGDIKLSKNDASMRLVGTKESQQTCRLYNGIDSNIICSHSHRRDDVFDFQALGPYKLMEFSRSRS